MTRETENFNKLKNLANDAINDFKQFLDLGVGLNDLDSIEYYTKRINVCVGSINTTVAKMNAEGLNNQSFDLFTPLYGGSSSIVEEPFSIRDFMNSNPKLTGQQVASKFWNSVTSTKVSDAHSEMRHLIICGLTYDDLKKTPNNSDLTSKRDIISKQFELKFNKASEFQTGTVLKRKNMVVDYFFSQGFNTVKNSTTEEKFNTLKKTYQKVEELESQLSEENLNCSMESLNGLLHGVLKINTDGHLYYDEEAAGGISLKSIYNDLKTFLKDNENAIFAHWKLKLQFLLHGFGEVIPYKWKQLHNFLSKNHGLTMDDKGNQIRNLDDWAVNKRALALLVSLKDQYDGGDWELLKQTYESIQSYSDNNSQPKKQKLGLEVIESGRDKRCRRKK